jgi:2-polyprenyl-6-methoxyphenol hydroxylase-like FAD-dependent oxidoreductase
VFGFHAADPDTDLTPWPSGPVTALGDAVHAMPPTGGRAAATAVRDADLLVRELTGGGPPVAAVHAYERAMPAYAVDAVRESLGPLRWMRPLGLPGAHRAAAAALRVAALPGHLRAAVG